MPISHDYFNASENIAQYRADQCGRQALSVAEIYANSIFVDLTLYGFDHEADSLGFDPWRIVTLDKSALSGDTNPYLVENQSGTRTFRVAPDYQLFVAKRDLTRLGIPVPESRMERHRRLRASAEHIEPLVGPPRRRKL